MAPIAYSDIAVHQRSRSWKNGWNDGRYTRTFDEGLRFAARRGEPAGPEDEREYRSGFLAALAYSKGGPCCDLTLALNAEANAA